ncbi:6.7 kDa chloroplast outer envelope membrane protein [Bienertia sinuspersici]
MSGGSTTAGAKEVPVKQAAIVVSVLAVGFAVIQFALKPFFNKKGNDSKEDKPPSGSGSAGSASAGSGSGSGSAPGVKKTEREAPPPKSASENVSKA